MFNTLEEHNLKRLMDLGLCVTVNSDDPAYFDGCITENLLAVQQALNLDGAEICRLSGNSFRASFLNQEEKQGLLEELRAFCDLSGISSNC